MIFYHPLLSAHNVLHTVEDTVDNTRPCVHIISASDLEP